MKTLSIAGALLSSALVAWAGNTTSLTLISGGGDAWDGIYMSPYSAYIGNGTVPTTVICDDFKDEVFLGETWNATTSTAAPVTLTGPGKVMWSGDPNAQADYNEAAWLATQLLLPANLGNTQTQAYISYAIWDIFDPIDVKNWLTVTYNDPSTLAGVQTWLSSAAPHSNDSFPNVLIYTPTGAPANYGLPQEFLAVQTVRADEASTIATLGFDFTCLAVLLYFFRRQLAAKLN